MSVIKLEADDLGLSVGSDEASADSLARAYTVIVAVDMVLEVTDALTVADPVTVPTVDVVAVTDADGQREADGLPLPVLDALSVAAGDCEPEKVTTLLLGVALVRGDTDVEREPPTGSVTEALGD